MFLMQPQSSKPHMKNVGQSITSRVRGRIKTNIRFRIMPRVQRLARERWVTMEAPEATVN